MRLRPRTDAGGASGPTSVESRATAGGIPRSGWLRCTAASQTHHGTLPRECVGDRQPGRLERMRGTEDLGGEWKPRKDRASVRWKRRVDATDSPVEQGLEDGQRAGIALNGAAGNCGVGRWLVSRRGPRLARQGSPRRRVGDGPSQGLGVGSVLPERRVSVDGCCLVRPWRQGRPPRGCLVLRHRPGRATCRSAEQPPAHHALARGDAPGSGDSGEALATLAVVSFEDSAEPPARSRAHLGVARGGCGWKRQEGNRAR